MARRVKNGWLRDDHMLALLTSKLGLAGIALALVLGVIATQSLRLAHAKADQIDPATHQPWKAEAQASARSLAACQASVATQNAAVDAQKAAGDRRAQMLVDALQSARGASVAARKRADAILAHKVVGPDECSRLLDVDRAVVAAGVQP